MNENKHFTEIEKLVDLRNMDISGKKLQNLFIWLQQIMKINWSMFVVK